MNNKIKNISELKIISEELRSKGKRIVFTNGCFDILHKGHVYYLREAKDLGNILIVAINSDASVKSIKGEKRPITTEDERSEIIASLESVDYVIIFDESSPLNLIKEIQPDILVKGGDWKIENVIGRDVVEARGGRVYTIPPIEGSSTTGIVERIIRKFT